MSDKNLPVGVTNDFWVNTQEEDLFPLPKAFPGYREDADGNIIDEIDDELIFECDVPVVVRSRYRLALKLARHYGGDCSLYDFGVSPNHEWTIIFNGVRLGEVIPLPCNTAEGFLRSYHLTHELLELVYEKGLTLAYIISGNEASVSAPVKGDTASNKDG